MLRFADVVDTPRLPLAARLGADGGAGMLGNGFLSFPLHTVVIKQRPGQGCSSCMKNQSTWNKGMPVSSLNSKP